MEYENNLFFIGEIVDVDAMCGGYNLQWALSSAALVADFLTNTQGGHDEKIGEKN